MHGRHTGPAAVFGHPLVWDKVVMQPLQDSGFLGERLFTSCEEAGGKGGTLSNVPIPMVEVKHTFKGFAELGP